MGERLQCAEWTCAADPDMPLGVSRALLGGVLTAAALGCSPIARVGPPAAASRAVLRDTDAVTAAVVSFWSAAAAGDRRGMAAVSVSSRPIEFAEAWVQRRPGFFSRTQASLRVVTLDTLRGPSDTVHLELEFDELVCDRKNHGFERRSLGAAVVLLPSGAKIAWIAMAPC